MLAGSLAAGPLANLMGRCRLASGRLTRLLLTHTH